MSHSSPKFAISTLLPNDKYLIVASDGVFEFLTNQAVADEVATHRDPLAACQAVVNKAYHLWLQYEVRTDDITMVALYLDDIPDGGVFDASSSFHEKGAEPVSSEERPVRRVMSREKRKEMIMLKDEDAEAGLNEEEMRAQMTPKSAPDAVVIGNAIKSNFLFQHLDAVQHKAVISCAS
jgi:hypothetical protein